MERYGIIHNGLCIEVVRGSEEEAIKRRDEIEKVLRMTGMIIKKGLSEFPEVFGISEVDS